MGMFQTVVYSLILFYATGQPYDIFSNTTYVPVSMELNGKNYRAESSEALFQGIKGLASQRQAAEALIQDKKTPLSRLRERAEHLGFNQPGNNAIYNQSYQGAVTVKEEVMYQLLLAKATQQIEICKALLDTGTKSIIENTAINKRYNDDFWGNGHNGKGRNALGKAWMRVRYTLSQELKTGKIDVRAGISDNLASTLHFLQHRTGSLYNGRYITRHDLQRVQGVILVSDLSKGKYSHNRSLNKRNKGTAEKRVLKATGATRIKMIDDKNNPNRKVLALTFKTLKESKQFALLCGNAPLNGNIVILGQNRALLVFKKLQIEFHGRTHQRPMWNVLLWEMT